MEMHDGDYQYLAVFDCINEAVRKSMGAATADFCIQLLPRLWPLDNTKNRRPDFGKKFATQARSLLLIVTGRRPQLFHRRRQQAEIHFPNSSLMERNVSSPSTAFNSPARKALSRSRDSAFQNWSIACCSAGSRLCHSASIMCAFSSAESFKASFSRALLLILKLYRAAGFLASTARRRLRPRLARKRGTPN